MNSWKWTLAAGCALCLLLAGCRVQGDPSSAQAGPTGSGSIQDDSQPEGTPGVGNVVGGSDFAPVQGDPVEESARGKARITYNGNESTVRYVTSVSQLPPYQPLSQYDDAFFQDHALVVVTESVPSGSMDVEIDSIRYTDTKNSVVLYHSAPQDDQAGTNDMATWLLWAEVDRDIQGAWMVANPALASDAEKY